MNESLNENNYLKVINDYPAISNEEILELFSLYKQGITSAKEKIILSNLNIVIRIAKKYATDEVKYDDLVQEGIVGLIKSIDKYDYNINNNFRVYAIYWIQKYIFQYIHDSKMIVLPEKIDKKLKDIERIKYNNPLISDDEVCDLLGFNRDELDRLLSYKYSRIQLDDCDDIKTIDSDALIKGVLMDLLSNIDDDKNRLIVKMYLGLYPYNEMSFDRIGKQLNMSKVAVYKRYNKTIEKLRKEYDK